MNFRENLLLSWQEPTRLTTFLLPLSWLYKLIFNIRRKLYEVGFLSSYRATVPVVVVGNLTVGGTGKTPLVIHLVELLRQYGYSPGVISRGYSGDAPYYPYEVNKHSSVQASGDEPALIVKRTNVPMVVGPNRGKSIDTLLANHHVDVIISDDGLQHLALQRDIEICLMDKTSKSKNTHLLPAGPYRESLSRLNSVDLVVHHQSIADEQATGRFTLSLIPSLAMPLIPSDNQELRELDKRQRVHAVAGIGNPQRFFKTCYLEGYEFEEHSFPDHHQFVESDFDFGDSKPVLMTEKDAVKCNKFYNENLWYLPVNAKMSSDFSSAFIGKINAFKNRV